MAGSHFTGPVYSTKGFVGAKVINSSNIYECITAGTSAGALFKGNLYVTY